MHDTIDERLADLEARVQALESRRSRKTPASKSTVALLHAIYAAIEGRDFTSKELIAHAMLPQIGDALRVALDAAIGPLGKRCTRRLGVLLSDAYLQPVASFKVVRIKQERDGMLWRLEAIA